ncbi:MAG: DNA methyltransferase [Oscillospiraceae bacterium]
MTAKRVLDEGLIYEILSVVEEIPQGCVATYGQIARLIEEKRIPDWWAKYDMAEYYEITRLPSGEPCGKTCTRMERTANSSRGWSHER